MKISFRIEYNAEQGDVLFITGSLPQLGEWEPLNAVALEGGPQWSLQMEIPVEGELRLDYKYCLKRSNGELFFEAGAGRSLLIKGSVASIVANDQWQGNDSSAPFLTAPFTEVFYRGGEECEPFTRVGSCSKELIIRATIPNVERSAEICICGNTPQLGLWDPSKALPMQRVAGVKWEAHLPAQEEEFEYKFIKRAVGSNANLQWEEGENRHLAVPAMEKHSTYIVEHSAAGFCMDKPHFKGIAVPLFSLKSNSSWGIGDFEDIKLLADYAHRRGLSILQFLPINDTSANMNWRDSYPYNCISVFALHPIYLAVESVGVLEDQEKLRQYRRQARLLNRRVFLDYEEVLELKMGYLRELFEQEWPKLAGNVEFADFCRQNSYWLEGYTRFCVLRDMNGTAEYSQWRKRDNLPQKEIDFYNFLQYNAYLQMRSAKEYAHSKGIALKGDLPIGVARYGAESWQHPQLFNFGVQAGAPPDAFSTEGQNWGFPTYNWEEMAKDDYLWWRRRLKYLSNFFDAYRIDHVLGFFRMWEIPLMEPSNRGHFSPALPYSVMEITERTNLEPKRHPALFVPDKVAHHSSSSAFLESATADARYSIYSINRYHPAVSAMLQEDFAKLRPQTRERFRALYNDYFYSRNEDLWYKNAMRKLQVLIASTGMLACAEDLGMLSPAVHKALGELKILSLEVQNLPKQGEIGKPADYPYLSVCTTSTHDTETLRMWLGKRLHPLDEPLEQEGRYPDATPEECAAVIEENLHSASLFVILPLQDWLSVSIKQRSRYPETERINNPANPDNYWRYRMEVSLEDL